MKKSPQYRKIVEWSEEDRCYVGRCPELMLGGVHGENEQKVFADLCAVIEEWIEVSKKDNEPLPPGLAVPGWLEKSPRGSSTFGWVESCMKA